MPERRYTDEELAAAVTAERERCLAIIAAIGCDWRDGGEHTKFYAANHLAKQIREQK